MLAITQVPSAADRGVGGSVRTPWGKLPACPNSVPKLAASATIVRLERVLLLMATLWVIEATARAQEASPVDFEPELEQIDAPSLSTIITSAPPRVLDYLKPEADYWKMYPDTPAREFARFEALVRNGQPYIRPCLTVGRDAPPEYLPAIAAQQTIDLERSIQFCKETLGIGES